MSRVPPTGAAPARKIEALLADLGPQLHRGGLVREPAARCRSGVPDVDRLLGGGFPLGALSEISGAPSSGRTSLALTLLATTTRAGELVGLVDGADAFDPLSAERAGVDLDRVLWVRAQAVREALRCSERLIQTEGFPLVLLDWTSGPAENVPAAAWIRLTRMAASSQTAVLLLSTERLAGTHADLVLEMQRARARFTGTPALLEELEARVMLVRHKLHAAPDTSASTSATTVSVTHHCTRSAPHESAA